MALFTLFLASVSPLLIRIHSNTRFSTLATCTHRSHYSWFRPTIQHTNARHAEHSIPSFYGDEIKWSGCCIQTIVKNFLTFMAFYYVNFRRYVRMGNVFFSRHSHHANVKCKREREQTWTDFFRSSRYYDSYYTWKLWFNHEWNRSN